MTWFRESETYESILYQNSANIYRKEGCSDSEENVLTCPVRTMCFPLRAVKSSHAHNTRVTPDAARCCCKFCANPLILTFVPRWTWTGKIFDNWPQNFQIFPPCCVDAFICLWGGRLLAGLTAGCSVLRDNSSWNGH